MTRPEDELGSGSLEGAVTALFCLVDDAYQLLNPEGARRYEGLKRLSDSEVLTLTLLQQLRGVESERSFLREAARFFPRLFPGVVGLVPSSLHRRIRKLRRFLEPLRRAVLPELVGEPETLLETRGDIHGVLRWELRPDGNDTVLIFSSTLDLPEEYRAVMLAGWHYHLDALAETLEGRPVDIANVPDDHWEQVYERYAARLA